MAGHTSRIPARRRLVALALGLAVIGGTRPGPAYGLRAGLEGTTQHELAAAVGLEESGPRNLKTAWAAIKEGLNSPSPADHRRAFRMLAALGPRAATSSFLTRLTEELEWLDLDDPSSLRVGLRAVQALGPRVGKHRRLLVFLTTQLVNRRPSVRAAAFRALMAAKPTMLSNAFLTALAKEISARYSSSLKFILGRLLFDRRPAIRAEAVDTLLLLGSLADLFQFLDTIHLELTDRPPHTVEDLLKIPRMSALLVRALVNPNPWVRSRATEIMEALRHAEAPEELLGALSQWLARHSAPAPAPILEVVAGLGPARGRPIAVAAADNRFVAIRAAVDAYRTLRSRVEAVGKPRHPIAARGPTFGVEVIGSEEPVVRVQIQSQETTAWRLLAGQLEIITQLLRRARPLTPEGYYLPMHWGLGLSARAVAVWGPRRARREALTQLMHALAYANLPWGRNHYNITRWYEPIGAPRISFQWLYLIKPLRLDELQRQRAAGRSDVARLELKAPALWADGSIEYWGLMLRVLHQLFEYGTPDDAERLLHDVLGMFREIGIMPTGLSDAATDRRMLADAKLWATEHEGQRVYAYALQLEEARRRLTRYLEATLAVLEQRTARRALMTARATERVNTLLRGARLTAGGHPNVVVISPSAATRHQLWPILELVRQIPQLHERVIVLPRRVPWANGGERRVGDVNLAVAEMRDWLPVGCHVWLYATQQDHEADEFDWSFHWYKIPFRYVHAEQLQLELPALLSHILQQAGVAGPTLDAVTRELLGAAGLRQAA